MHKGQTLLQSADKNNGRPSILKGSSSKNRIVSSNKMGQSTAIGQTVTFKEPSSEQKQIKQFRQDSPFRYVQQIPIQKKASMAYSELMLLKDVKFVNNLYKHIFLMITSADKQLQCDKPQNKDIKRMLTAIEKILVQNMHLKQQIQQEYKHVADLLQLAEYLAKTPEQLLAGTTLQDFFIDFNRKQQQLEVLEKEYAGLKSLQKHKIKSSTLTEQQKKQKDKRCRQLRKQIEREMKKIFDLQNQQKQLLSTLYKAQKEIIKNQRTSSTLKMKINEIECQRSYKQMKNKKTELMPNQMQEKENISEACGKIKYVKIQNRERIKRKKSLAKFFRK